MLFLKTYCIFVYMTQEEFLKRAREVHGAKYDFSKTVYTKLKNNVIVTCPQHGDFVIRSDHFLNGRGCRKCSQSIMTTESFIEKARKVHGDKYDYSKVDYKKSGEKVAIICPIHGVFYQTPNSHLNGRGCRKCGDEKTHERCNKGLEAFIEQSKKVHGNKYDYSKATYIRNRIKTEIICPTHGSFFQTPTCHLRGEGCPKCRYVNIAAGQALTTEEFIKRAREKHGDKYDYSKVEYRGYEEYVTIGCPIHGYFQQSPDSHLHSGGCPKCGVTLSTCEDELFNYIKALLPNEEVRQRDRTVLNRKEIDIFIPSRNIGIEYNGLFWHSEKNTRMDRYYHLNKTEEAKAKGIFLIQIFEDEYVNHKEIVLSKIRHILKCDNQPKIMARKCEVRTISKKESEEFLNKFHIQGFRRATKHYGAFYNGELVAVMSFNQEIKNGNDWELTRFASNINYIVEGAGGKLLKHFIREQNPTEIKTFLDRRWAVSDDDNVYNKLGFTIDGYLEPDYRYYNDKVGKYERIHKFNFRKNALHRKYGLPLTMTEKEMTEKLGYYKIWDCGLIRYIWKKENN